MCVPNHPRDTSEAYGPSIFLRKKAHKHKLFALVNVQMALGQTARCPRVNRAKKFMCSPRNTGNINVYLWLTGGLSQGCPDFQKVYVFKVYVPFLALKFLYVFFVYRLFLLPISSLEKVLLSRRFWSGKTPSKMEIGTLQNANWHPPKREWRPPICSFCKGGLPPAGSHLLPEIRAFQWRRMKPDFFGKPKIASGNYRKQQMEVRHLRSVTGPKWEMKVSTFTVSTL